MIHTLNHSSEDIILNPDIFKDIKEGNYVQIFDPDRPENKIIVKVPTLKSAHTNRLEISLSKIIADRFQLKPYSRVTVSKVEGPEANVDFVELAFRRQFLQRGNMWRFKKTMIGKAVYVGQNIVVDGIQAQIQEVGCPGQLKVSGVVSESTHFIFRSRSAKIVWLVQISAEMWEYDQNGELYFEKFLSRFVDNLLDRWKALSVSHALTVIFFARTLYVDNRHQATIARQSDNTNDAPGNNHTNIKEMRLGVDGPLFEDYYKVVMDKRTDINKTDCLRTLKKAFWDFPIDLKWRISQSNAVAVPQTMSDQSNSNETVYLSNISAVPSDAVDGNALEAINTTLNLMDKHYRDRDLQRTGNSIVMTSAGTGFFRVDRHLAQITKQRMMDNGIGMDFISLSYPPLHTVPLFYVRGELSDNSDSYYEVPYWMNVTFVDCPIDSSATIANAYHTTNNSTSTTNNRKSDKRNSATSLVIENHLEQRWTGLSSFYNATEDRYEDYDNFLERKNVRWGAGFKPLPFFSRVAAHVSFLESDVGGLASLSLPSALKNWISRKSSTESIDASVTNSTSPIGKLCETAQMAALSIPEWGYIAFPAWDTSDASSVSSGRFSVPPLPPLPVGFEGLKNERVSASFEDADDRRLRDVHERESLGSYEGRTGRSVGEPGHRGGGSGGSGSSDLAAGAPLRLALAAVIAKLAQGNALTEDTLLMLGDYDRRSLLDEKLIDDLCCGDRSSHQQHKSPRTRSKSPSTRTKLLNPNNNVSSASKPVVIPSSVEGEQSQGASRSIRFAESCKSSQNASMAVSRSLEEKTELSTSRAYGSPVSYFDSRRSPVVPNPYLVSRGGDRLGYRNDAIRGVARTPPGSGLTPHGSRRAHSGSISDGHRRASNAINPFNKKEEAKNLSVRTHNRRRWSHVFPTARLDDMGYLGLNWKSLTQPAILPLTTDFKPKTKNAPNFTEASRDLFIGDAKNFNTEANLMKEMVCQRLSQEFQLYIDPATKLEKAAGTGGGSSTSGAQQKISYQLTMGHVVQELTYCPAQRKVTVDVFQSTAMGTNDPEEKKFAYKYQLWVPETKEYKPMQQLFYQYPHPAYDWNKVDEILSGYADSLTDDTSQVKGCKAKRLHFVIIPEAVNTKEEADGYHQKFDKFVTFLKSKVEKTNPDWDIQKETFEPAKDISGSDNTSSVRLTNMKDIRIDLKLWLRGPNHENPKWVYLSCDAICRVDRVYHIDILWIVCDSWLLDEFVTLLLRRCGNAGLRMAQVPELLYSSNLQMNPYKACPYVGDSNSDASDRRFHTASIVERLYFRTDDWIADDEQFTDWRQLGLEEPSYPTQTANTSTVDSSVRPSTVDNITAVSTAVACKEPTADSQVAEKPSQPATIIGLLQKSLRKSEASTSNSSLTATSSPPAPSVGSIKAAAPKGGLSDSGTGTGVTKLPVGLSKGTSRSALRRRKRETDRQYMHRQVLASVRVAKNGFIWIVNSPFKVSDMNSSTEDLNRLAAAKITEFQKFYSSVHDVIGLLCELLDDILNNTVS